MYTDLMLDLEYLAQGDNGVITQIATVPFDIETGYYKGLEEGKPVEAFNCSPNVQEQLRQGRVIDESTMAWWMNQCADNKATPNWLDDEEMQLDATLSHYIPIWGKELFDWDSVRVWSHVGYDVGKLRYGCDQLGCSVPWDRKNEWHLQTVLKLARLRASDTQCALLERYRGERDHDALQDCVAQIKEVTLAWEILHG